MIIEQLDLETRTQVYSYTKKILRKYQKGIISGKLTADKFAENILSNDDIKGILDEKVLNGKDFKSSYIDYIETLIKIQNKSLNNSKKKKSKDIDNKPQKPTISQQIKLRNILEENSYTLNIPQQYLSSSEVDNIIDYVNTGEIELGNERIYNYITKNTSH